MTNTDGTDSGGGGGTSADKPDRDQSGRRCGFIAVVGAPNAGKSTLVNALVGAKVTIVSHKVQTTRAPVRGIVAHGDSQLVFLDTPGIFQPKRLLDKAMVEAAWGGAGDADIVALIIDAQKGLTDDVVRIVDKLDGAPGRQKILLINKIDRLADKASLLELVAKVTERATFDEVFMISALNSDGLDALRDYLAKAVPEGAWHYPEDEMSDLPIRMLAAEITREKIYHRLHDELPYAITVETSDWKVLRNKSVRVEQTIYVERDSQKAIVLGKGGQTIKQISSDARADISEIIEQPVHLFLFVKVRQGWGGDPERYREMGLAFPKS
ncbi:MAG: GTPase Era [Pseudomonadota bacterium]